MYSLGMPVSAIRTKVRQEFEKHRYVQQLSAVDVLLFKSHAEFQVTFPVFSMDLEAIRLGGGRGIRLESLILTMI